VPNVRRATAEPTIRPVLAALVTVMLFTLSLSAQAPTPAPAAAPGDEPVYDALVDKGVSPPKLIEGPPATYTSDAMRRKLQGSIKLKCVVSRDGTTRDVQLVSGLEEQMDAKAVAALKQWKFKPARYDGKPVAARVSVEMTFTLR